MLTEKTLTSIREDLPNYDEGDWMPTGTNDVADLVNEIDRNRIALKQREDLLDSIARIALHTNEMVVARETAVIAEVWRELRAK